MAQITFSPKEAQVLRHRIEVPDCMAEVFSDMGDGNPWGLTDLGEITDKVCAVIDEVFADAPRGGLTLTFNPESEDHRLVITVSTALLGTKTPLSR
jgi:hypothetical protein